MLVDAITTYNQTVLPRPHRGLFAESKAMPDNALASLCLTIHFSKDTCHPVKAGPTVRQWMQRHLSDMASVIPHHFTKGRIDNLLLGCAHSMPQACRLFPHKSKYAV